MNKEKEQAITVLNSLIEINNDRIEGYATASKETDQADLKTLFALCTRTSQKCKAELVLEVRNLGSTPMGGTRASGKFFRAWMDVKVALTVNDRRTILDSCEYGEHVASETYNNALKDNRDDLTNEQQRMVHAQHVLLQADHDKIKGLRDLITKGLHEMALEQS